MAILKNIVAITGKYTNKEGADKNQYLTIGRVIETKNGEMLKIESIPVGWDGWAYLNDPRPKDGQRQPSNQGDQPPFDDQDSIPF